MSQLKNCVGITERGDAGLELDEWLARDLSRFDFVVAVTKAPSELVNNFDRLPKKMIIHATVTGWGSTSVEPNVRPMADELEAYKELVDRLDGDRVILRIDPIIPTSSGIDLAKRVYSFRRGRVRVSVFDAYKHALQRLRHADTMVYDEIQELYTSGLHAPLSLRQKVLSNFLDAEVCGEPDFDCTGCVSSADYRALQLHPPLRLSGWKQRDSCRCLSAKTELLKRRHPCEHQCAYCYWKN